MGHFILGPSSGTQNLGHTDGSTSVCTHVTVAVQVVFAVTLYTVNVL